MKEHATLETTQINSLALRSTEYSLAYLYFIDVDILGLEVQ